MAKIADKSIFLKEMVYILMKISLKLVSEVHKPQRDDSEKIEMVYWKLTPYLLF